MQEEITLKTLKQRYHKSVQMPECFNSLAFEAIEKLGDKNAAIALKEGEANRWYETIYARSANGQIKAYFEVAFGVALQWKLVKKYGDSVEAHINIKNPMVTNAKKGNNIKTDSIGENHE